jgi:hypothetical protein
MKLSIILGTLVTSVVSLAAPSLAGEATNPYGTTYGYGENYFDICNQTDRTRVTFYTDETNHEHWLEVGECDRIYTNWDYINVTFDNSWQYGDQFTEVVVNTPYDLLFINSGENKFGEKVGYTFY